MIDGKHQVGEPQCEVCGGSVPAGFQESVCPRCMFAAAGETDLARPSRIGDSVGRYKLLEKLGEGGFGSVYLAEQREPVVRRVALKIIKDGMDTRQVIARFEAERQALAMMDHPNIAKVLDVGETEFGRPYFVMELVQGIPVTKFCDEQRQNLRQRLELFCDICAAVQHAHQKGIIHRDLKPSNIIVGLVDDAPVAKVIDFGIAKATQGQLLTDKTLYTQIEQFIGTPAYISPEQTSLSVLDIDTRSDIYSLGIVLYELLTGKLPIERKTLLSAGMEEMRRMIREKEAPKPSTRLSAVADKELRSIANARCTEPKKLGLLIRGDLDWIILKSLEKDRTRRYETANALRADILRLLNDEPVSASPPSPVYRIRKFARRNKGVLAGGLLLAVTLISGILATSWQAYRANKNAQDADEARAGMEEQRNLAEQRSIEASNAKEKAEDSERIVREQLYATDLVATQYALQEGDLGAATRYLESHIPRKGERDLRGFPWRHYSQRARGDQVHTFRGHDALVYCVAWSPAGKFLASGDWGEPSNVIIWDVAKRRPSIKLEMQGGKVVSVAYKQDGSLLAVGCETMLSLFSLDSNGVPTLRSRREADWPYIAFLPDSTRLIVGEESDFWGNNSDSKGVTRIWDYERDEIVREFPRSGGKFALTGDARTLYTGVRDNCLWKWDISTGDLRERISFYPAAPSLACSQDGRWLVYGTGDRPCYGELLETTNGKKIQFMAYESHFPLRGLSFSGDGRFAGAPSAELLVQIWDANNMSLDPIQLRGHGSEIWGTAFSPDNKYLATCAKDHTVRLWDSWFSEGGLPELIGGARYSQTDADPLLAKDGQTMAALNASKNLALWDTATGKELGVFTGGVIPLGFTGEGTRLTTLGETFILRTFDVRSQKLLHEKELSPESTDFTTTEFTPNHSHLIMVRWDGRGVIWNAATGESLTHFKSDGGSVRDLAVLPDGNRFVTASGSEGVELWDLEGTKIRSFRPHSGKVRCVAVSPDGTSVAADGGEESIVIWQLDTGKILTTLRGHRMSIKSLEFSPAGDTLASASDDASVKLWDLRTGKQVVNWNKGTQSINHLAFSANESVLAFTEGERSTRIHLMRAPFSPEDDEVVPAPIVINEGGLGLTGERLLRELELIRGLPVTVEIARKKLELASLQKAASLDVWKKTLAESDRDLDELTKSAAGRAAKIISIAECWMVDWVSTDKLEERAIRAREILLSIKPTPASAAKDYPQLVPLLETMWNSLLEANEIEKALTIGQVLAEALEITRDADDLDLFFCRLHLALYCMAIEREEESQALIRKLIASGAAKAVLNQSQSPEVRSIAFALQAMKAFDDGQLAISRKFLAKAELNLGARAFAETRDEMGFGSFGWLLPWNLVRDARILIKGKPEYELSDDPSVKQLIVPERSEWKWLHPKDGTDPAVADEDFHNTFYALDYDDSEWSTGQDGAGPCQGFGYGEDPFLGVDIGKPVGRNDRCTAYFRHRFTTSQEHQDLEIRCQRDDGIIVYLDGVEVIRDNVREGLVSHRLFATDSVPASEETRIRRFAIPGRLPAGDHVLAISLHNREGGSSDLRIAEVSLLERVKITED